MKKILSLFLVFCGFPFVSHADPADYCGNFLTLSVAGALPRPNSSQTFFLEPEVEKTFTVNTSKDVIFNAEAFGGWQNAIDLLRPVDLFGQLGLTLSLSNTAEVRGNIWEDANPAFNNFRYSFELTHAQIGVKGKFFIVAGNFCDIYASAGVGVGFNQARKFTITPLIIEEVPMPAFTNKTNTTASYSAGVGAQTSFSPNWKASLGYEFMNWGKVELNRAPGQTLHKGLMLNHYYLNAIVLGITYIV